MGRKVLFLLLISCNLSYAQTYTHETYARQMSVSESISPLPRGFGSFGESVDFNSGSLSFQKTLLEIPGNNSLRVAADYVFSVWDRLDWYPRYELRRSTPYIYGVHSYDNGWVVGRPGAYSRNRCSDPARLGVASVVRSTKPPVDNYLPEDYWDGNTLMGVPGAGVIRPIDPAEPNIPGGEALWATNTGWRFSCYILNDGSEGFVGHSPDGNKYYFGIPERGPDIQYIMSSFRSDVDSWLEVSVYKMHLLRVEDRFGNWVKYSHDQIESSDGRKISFYPDRVESGGRRWGISTSTSGNGIPDRYSYTIANPDGSIWSISVAGQITNSYYTQSNTCLSSDRIGNYYTGEMSITVNSESGAVGVFRLAPVRRGLSHVPYNCIHGGLAGPYFPENQNYVDSVGLIERKESGPSIETVVHTIDYGSPNYCYSSSLTGGVPDPCTSISANTRDVTVRGSHGYVDTYVYGNKYMHNSGLLLSHNESGKRVTRYDYAFPYSNFHGFGKRRIFDVSEAYVPVEKSKEIILDGMRYVRRISMDCGQSSRDICIDQHNRPFRYVVESSFVGD